jgi:hypothetical protein
MFPLFATGINNTSSAGGKFTAGVVDTVVHLDLQISANFRQKFNLTNVIFRGFVEDDK